MTHPDKEDVVVRHKRRNASTVYVRHTTSTPGQFLYRTRKEAVSHVMAVARHTREAERFTNEHDDFVLLRTVRTIATRTYHSGNRTFEIALSGTPAGWWTVEHVYDKSLNQEISVPGMDSIVASTGDAAFARTRDHVDQWLRYRVPS
jgi:hypothetical protein